MSAARPAASAARPAWSVAAVAAGRRPHRARRLDGAKVVAPGTPCAPPRPGTAGAARGRDRDPRRRVLGAMDGHLRAFSTADGTLLCLWDVDTAKP
jgi:hypothetical protein